MVIDGVMITADGTSIEHPVPRPLDVSEVWPWGGFPPDPPGGLGGW